MSSPIVVAGTCDKQPGHRFLWLDAVANSQDTDCCGWKNSLLTVRCGMEGTVEVIATRSALYILIVLLLNISEFSNAALQGGVQSIILQNKCTIQV